MPFSASTPPLCWSSINFSFNKIGRIKSFEVVFRHDIQDITDAVKACAGYLAELKQNRNFGESLLQYDEDKRLLRLPYWSIDDSAFVEALLEQTISFFNIDDDFAERFSSLVFNHEALANEHLRLVNSMPKPIDKSSNCFMM